MLYSVRSVCSLLFFSHDINVLKRMVSLRRFTLVFVHVEVVLQNGRVDCGNAHAEFCVTSRSLIKSRSLERTEICRTATFSSKSGRQYLKISYPAAWFTVKYDI